MYEKHINCVLIREKYINKQKKKNKTTILNKLIYEKTNFDKLNA